MRRITILLAGVAVVALAGNALADDVAPRTGAAAYGDWRTDAPGVRRLLTPAEMPAPLATAPAANPSRLVARPADATLKAPPGFEVSLFAKGLTQPRIVRVAPNGDIFVAESAAGRVRVLRAPDGAREYADQQTFATGLDRPFGIAFYPPGPEPRFVYVATNTRVMRYPYRNGDMTTSGPPEIIATLPGRGGHWTRDIAFSKDGATMYVSVGSGSNVAEEMEPLSGDALKDFVATHALGATWGEEEDRADVLAFDPDGHGKRVVAAGIRNCVGLAVQPENGALWCSTNERDIMGDDLPPDYVTRVKDGGFYGWPWYYIGAHEDPRHAGERPDLAGSITLPDVLIQPHSAPLGMAFYEGAQFPAEYRGDAFVALQGSWNRAKKTGCKVVRLLFKDGQPTGVYEDFLIGFVANDTSVWGTPVGVAVAHDGALLLTDDGGGVIWRVAYKGL
jgi:glucose/arabinose dehydrogenase